MKVYFYAQGKVDSTWMADGIEVYLGRLRHYLPIVYNPLPPPKLRGNGPQETKAGEGEALLRLLKPTDVLLLLDARGRPLSSEAFAADLDRRLTQGAPGGGNLVYASGGAHGWSHEVRARAQDLISLSPLTFTHDMVRLIFLEQLYRAMTIIKGQPYHHGGE